jgi:Muconolactone delta-isomerase
MNITAAILTIKDDVKVEELAEVLKHEREVIVQWTQAGHIYDFFLRQTRNGAVLLFKDLDEAEVREMIAKLPLFPYLKPVEYLGLIKQA